VIWIEFGVFEIKKTKSKKWILDSENAAETAQSCPDKTHDRAPQSTDRAVLTGILENFQTSK